MYTDAMFEPFPTLPKTPPIALLTASIQRSKAETAPLLAAFIQRPTQRPGGNPKEYSVWQAAFCIRIYRNAVAKVDGKVYNRAKIRRLL